MPETYPPRPTLAPALTCSSATAAEPGANALPPLRRLALIAAAVGVAGAGILAPGLAHDRPARVRLPRALAAADTDSVARRPGRLPATPSTPSTTAAADSAAADSVAGDTARRVAAYVRPLQRRPYARTSRQPAFLGPIAGGRLTTVLDSTTDRFTVREQFAGLDARLPVVVGLDAYRDLRLEEARLRLMREGVSASAQRRERTSRGLGVSIVVPGGRQSAFTTIFGKNEVALRVTGGADVNAGFEYRRSEQQTAIQRRSQLDPTFQQDLSLGVVGTIGDKLRINMDRDSRNKFDFENQLKIKYTGYEDEIVQSVEAGNVLLQTPSTLIRGGQSLFGIKSEFRLGGLRLTTVASQEEGQSNTLSITGGAEQQTFTVKSSDYDDGRHFFLGYYFRNGYETSLGSPPDPLTFSTDDDGRPGVVKIVKVDVWRLTATSPQDRDIRKVAALVDLGERPEILRQTVGAPFTRRVVPSPAIDQYTDAELNAFIRRRADTLSVDRYLTTQRGLRDADFQTGNFKRLTLDRDYVYNERTGTLSLSQRLNESEAVAVAFTYQNNAGELVEVGDFASSTGGSTSDDYLVLKLLRRRTPQAPPADAVASSVLPAAWPLEMRNIYTLPGRGLSRSEFNLAVEYEAPGIPPASTLPGQTTPLLQVTGLDRLSSGNSPGSDNQFDFLEGLTIDPERGLLVFPYLEPFGSRITRALGDSALAAGFAYRDLYLEKKEEAKRNTLLDVYRLRGKYQGSVQRFFDLRAYSGLIANSVKVKANGIDLVENVDYSVDYTGGTVTVTNEAYLRPGQNVQISYEQNQFFSSQKKSLLGLRADYDVRPGLALGSTLMRLTQRSAADKFRIGDEPVSNVIWGLDGRYEATPRWVTTALDRLPLLTTRAPSKVLFSGEFAQLRPGNPQSLAFQRERELLRDDGRDFFVDERGGVSFIDDFENFENNSSLKAPGAWSLASAPDSIPAIDFGGVARSSLADSLRTTWRGGLAWYTLSNEFFRDGTYTAFGPRDAVDILEQTDVYNVSQGASAQLNQLSTMDLYFDPSWRGPYNYTTNLPGFVAAPKKAWGGLTTRIPDQYSDFDLKNVEFIEFVMRPFTGRGGSEGDDDAALFVDLGRISEDVLPDGKDNSEDGLTLERTKPQMFSTWGRTPDARPDRTINLENGRTEDLGLDGLVSTVVDNYTEDFTEAGFYRRFLDALPAGPTGNAALDAEAARARRDPSGDDYHHFRDNTFYQSADYFGGRDGRSSPEAYLQQRFLQFYPGHELNDFVSQRDLDPASSFKTGNSSAPNSEDLQASGNTNTENAYYQYRIPLNAARLAALARPENADDFVIGETKEGSGWYLVRIPVRRPTRRVGGISDFTNMEAIRLWTTGHAVPATIRFAAMDLVASTWQKSDRVATERLRLDPFAGDSRFTVSSLNTEENPTTYDSPPGTVVTRIRGATGGIERAGREGALVMRTENLRGGRQRGIVKTFSTPMDLLRYSNVRMFTHLDGLDETGRPLTPEDRGRVAVVLRLGSNETTDFYEIEQPLVPSVAGAASRDDLWRVAENGVNVVLSALNQLKTARDNRLAAPDSARRSRLDRLFYNVRADGTRDDDLPATDFAPPGTRIGIRGNPSLSRVSTIVIAMRSLDDSTAVSPGLREVNVWANELRVSGYDQTNGWSAIGNLDVGLADIGSIRANVQRATDGFGALASTLGERDKATTYGLSVTGQFALDRFLPARAGWSIPINASFDTRSSTPRFTNARGDVRLDAALDAIDQRTTNDDGTPITDAQRESLRRRELEAAQNATDSRSISVSLGKRGSKSAWLKRTLDATTVTYSASQAGSRDPGTLFTDVSRWNGAVQYSLSDLRPRTLKPLWFLRGVPVVGGLGGLKFNYVPSAVRTGATGNRDFTASRERSPLVRRPDDPDRRPDLVRFPFREQHNFGHQRTFSLSYAPFSFLDAQFDSQVEQNLGVVGLDTLFTLVERSTGGESARSISRDEARLIELDTLSSTFVQRRLRSTPLGSTLSRIAAGDPRFHTSGYRQNLTLSLRPRLPERLNFLRADNIAVNAQYQWRNAPLFQNVGAGVGTSVTLGASLSLLPQTFWRKFDFYRDLEAEQQRADQARTQRQAREDTERRERAERRRTPPPPAAPAPTPVAVPATPVAEDSTARPTGSEIVPVAPAADSAAASPARGRGFRLPLPSGRGLLRGAVLAVGGISDIRVTYSGTFNNTGSAFAEGGDSTRSYYSFFDALRGRGPDLAYRVGLRRRLSNDERVFTSRLQPNDQLSDNHRLSATTRLQPTPNLSVALSWEVGWSQNTAIALRPDLATGSFNEVVTPRGQARSYIWAFGADFAGLFDRQIGALRADIDAARSDTVGDANGDGVVALSTSSLADDFRRSFVVTPGFADSRGFVPIPLPSFQITYTGANKWPLLRRLVTSASIRSNYSAEYNVPSYDPPGSATGSLRLDLSPSERYVLRYNEPGYSLAALNVSERYAPLVGASLGFRNQITTEVNYNRANLYALTTGSRELSARRTNELQWTVNYAKQGLRLPFVRNRLNNRFTANLTLSRAVNRDLSYRAQPAIVAGVAEGLTSGEILANNDFVLRQADNVRLTIAPSVSYQFSNAVTGAFTLKVEKFDTRVSQPPSFFNTSGLFNIRVNIASF